MAKYDARTFFGSLFSRLRHNRIHVLIWSIFVFQEVVLVGLFKQSFGNFWNYFIHYSINISIFYFHSGWLLPRVFKFQSYRAWGLVSFSLVELAAFTFLIYQLDLFLILHTDIMPTSVVLSHPVLIFGIVWRCLYFMMFSTGYYYFRAYMRERKEREELERERLLNAVQQEKIEKDLMVAKNAYLKAQINPHFLFNTLDFIYHDVVQHSPKSGEAVLGLAEIMRFALDLDYYGEYIPVEKELAQLENLITLYRLTGKGENLIDLDYDENVKQLEIIPLVILTLAENMLKHGDLKTTRGTLKIFRGRGFLHIASVNLIAAGKHHAGFGSGLANINDRLSGIYKGSASLEYVTEDGYFKAIISIPLNEQNRSNRSVAAR